MGDFKYIVVVRSSLSSVRRRVFVVPRSHHSWAGAASVVRVCVCVSVLCSLRSELEVDLGCKLLPVALLGLCCCGL